MAHKNSTLRLDPVIQDSPRHEAAIDTTSAIQERLDYASNAIEFARRQIRDGNPKDAAILEQIAHANLREAQTMLKEFLGGWELLLCDAKMEPLAYDRVIDDISKGKRPQDLPIAWQ
jgi:hypothetical protein